MGEASLENRVTLLENQTREIVDCIEQIARDADLMGVNVMRALKSMQSQKTAKPQQEKREWTWNPEKTTWTRDEGFKGPYEKSADVNNADFKAMLKDLQEHKGKLNRDGRFYWLFKSGSTVGRTVPKGA